MFACNFEKLGSRKLRRLPQIADFKARNTLRTRCDTAFVGIIVPSLWGGLGRGLTLLFFSGGHIGPHPTKRQQRTGHAMSLLFNSLTPEQGTRKGPLHCLCFRASRPRPYSKTPRTQYIASLLQNS